MSIPVELIDHGKKVRISKLGQLNIAAYAYDDVAMQTLSLAGVVKNFFRPKVAHQFIMTGIVLAANKSITGDVIVDIYEGSSEVATTVDRSILLLEMLKNERLSLMPLNLRINPGAWLNGKADDADVLISIFGYYVPAV